MTEQSEARKALRAKLLATRETKRVPVTFNGAEIELKQPTIAQIQSFQEGDTKFRFVKMLIEFAYVPGTNEKAFESGDLEVLVDLPYTPEITQIQEALTGFLVNNVGDAEKNSSETA